MTDYQVRKDGSNSNDGITAPWLTLSKALSTVPLAGNHRILMGDGVYVENTSASGYLLCQRQFLDWITIQPLGDSAGDVTVSGDTSTTYSLRFDPSQFLRFKWLKITSNQPLISGSYGLIALTQYPKTNFQFIGCNFIIRSGSANKSYALIVEVGGTSVANHFLFEDCTITQLGTDDVQAIRFDKTAAGATLDDIVIRNCNIEVTKMGLYLYDGVTNFLVDGGTYKATGASGYGAAIGVDGQTGRTNTGTVQNASFTSLLGHALLIGAGCSGVQVLNNQVFGGDQGLVVKHCDGAVVTGNNVQGGSINALYFKGATNVTASGNSVSNSQGNVLNVGVDSGDGTKCLNINFQHNNLFGTGSAGLMNWGGSTDDAGGGVCDYNILSAKGSGLIGLVKGNSHVTSLAALRAAWAGYGDGLNDSHTRKALTVVPNNIAPVRSISPDIRMRADWQLSAYESAGVVLNIDSLSNPQNFVIGYLDGYDIFLIKFVAGVLTVVFTDAVSYAAYRSLEVRKVGPSTYQLWYNGVKIGSDQTISDAGIVNNKLCGLYSSTIGNLCDFLGRYYL